MFRGSASFHASMDRDDVTCSRDVTRWRQSPTSSHDSAFYQQTLTSSPRDHDVSGSWRYAHQQQQQLLRSCGDAVDNVEKLRRLDESEARRLMLVQKMREAQATIAMQSSRMQELESFAHDKNLEVEQLRSKERENQRKLNSLDAEFRTIHQRLMDYLRMKEDLQGRLESLSCEVGTLRATNGLLMGECERKNQQLKDIVITADSLEQQIEQTNRELNVTRRDLEAAEKANSVAQNEIEQLQLQLTANKRDVDRLREENHTLMIENRNLQKQLTETRNNLTVKRDDTRTFTSQLLNTQTELQTSVRQMEQLQEELSQQRASLSAAETDKQRLLRDKLQLHQQLQNCILEYQQTTKNKEGAEELINEQRQQLNTAHKNIEQLTTEKKDALMELEAVKKVSEMLSFELSNSQSKLESVLEDMESLQRTYGSLLEEHGHCQQDKETFQHKLDSLQQEMEEAVNEEINQRQSLMEENTKLCDENVQLNNEIRQLKADKCLWETGVSDTDEKLKQSERIQKAQCDILRTELDKWKAASGKQLTVIQKKDIEIQTQTKRIQDLEDEVGFLKVNHNVYESQYNELVEVRQQLLKSEEETRRLLQERTENQEMIQLLEIQKNVLTQLCRPPLDTTTTTVMDSEPQQQQQQQQQPLPATEATIDTDTDQHNDDINVARQQSENQQTSVVTCENTENTNIA